MKAPNFRQIIGAGCVFGALAIVVLLFFVELPHGQSELMSALAGVLFTWGGRVVNSLFPTNDPPPPRIEGEGLR